MDQITRHEGLPKSPEHNKTLRKIYHTSDIRTPGGIECISSSEVKAVYNMELPSKETTALSRGTRFHDMAERVIHGDPVHLIEQERAGSKAYKQQVAELCEGDELVTKTDYQLFSAWLSQLHIFKESLSEGQLRTELVCVRPEHPWFRRAGVELGIKAQVDLLHTPDEEGKRPRIYDFKTTSKRTYLDLFREVRRRGYGYSAWHYVQTLNPYVKNLDPIVSFVFFMDKHEGGPAMIDFDTENAMIVDKEVTPYLREYQERKGLREKLIEGATFKYELEGGR